MALDSALGTSSSAACEEEVVFSRAMMYPSSTELEAPWERKGARGEWWEGGKAGASSFPSPLPSRPPPLPLWKREMYQQTKGKANPRNYVISRAAFEVPPLPRCSLGRSESQLGCEEGEAWPVVSLRLDAQTRTSITMVRRFSTGSLPFSSIVCVCVCLEFVLKIVHRKCCQNVWDFILRCRINTGNSGQTDSIFWIGGRILQKNVETIILSRFKALSHFSEEHELHHPPLPPIFYSVFFPFTSLLVR